MPFWWTVRVMIFSFFIALTKISFPFLPAPTHRKMTCLQLFSWWRALLEGGWILLLSFPAINTHLLTHVLAIMNSIRSLSSFYFAERARKLRRDQMMPDLVGRRGVNLPHPSCSSLSSSCHSSSLPNSDPLQQSTASLLLTSSSIDNEDIDGRRRMEKNFHCRQSQARKPPFSPSHPSHHSRMRNTHNRTRIFVISLTLVVISTCLLPTTTAAITEKCLRCICHVSIPKIPLQPQRLDIVFTSTPSFSEGVIYDRVQT